MSRTGKPLGQAVQRGRDNLGGSAWNPAKHAEQTIPVVARAKLEQLLNDPAIVGALQDRSCREQRQVAQARPRSARSQR